MENGYTPWNWRLRGKIMGTSPLRWAIAMMNFEHPSSRTQHRVPHGLQGLGHAIKSEEDRHGKDPAHFGGTIGGSEDKRVDARENFNAPGVSLDLDESWPTTSWIVHHDLIWEVPEAPFRLSYVFCSY